MFLVQENFKISAVVLGGISASEINICIKSNKNSLIFFLKKLKIASGAQVLTEAYFELKKGPLFLVLLTSRPMETAML